MAEHVIRAAAEAAYEVNRIYCALLGDHSQKSWNEAAEWQRVSAIDGVRVALAGATPEQQHEAWCEARRSEGWEHGLVKDYARKTHPCLVPYGALSPKQRAKDELYRTVVRAMALACEQCPPPALGSRSFELAEAIAGWAELLPEERTAALAAIANSTQPGKRGIRAALVLLEAAEPTGGGWSMANNYDERGA